MSMKKGKFNLFCARVARTGKIRNDITSTKRKYWDTRHGAMSAIMNYINKCPWERLELIELEVTEKESTLFRAN